MNLPLRLRARPAASLTGLLLTFVCTVTQLRAQPLNITLPGSARGAAAVSALGPHLPEVARAYGLSPQHLATLFQLQPSLAVDRHGHLHFLCEGLALTARDVPSVPGSTVAPADPTGESLPLTSTSATTDAFKLHSQPGSPRVIYLDFNGHTTTGTNWNTSYNGGAPIVSEPFSLDADRTTFNDSERTFIRNVWRRVAEDFAPFSVNVTTEDPGIEGLRRTDTNDASYGIRVVISPTNWYGSAGGVGYIGSFRASTDTPVFVFTANLGNSEKPVAECASHEVGHSVGLYHDGLGGSNPTEYYRGHGNWAPIMGNSYYNAVTQFSRGEYANANNPQDDLAVIQGYIALMIDDHGNTLDTATALAGPNVADGGTIHTRTDVDVFRFSTGAGTIMLNIAGPSPQPNLDLKAELLSASGQLLQVSDSSPALNAGIAATLPAGTYYLRLSGVGAGDPLTTGYSNYASLGDYVITGTLVATSDSPNQLPVAVASGGPLTGTAPLPVTFSSAGSYDPDGSIVSYAWDFGDGTSSTAASPTKTYSTAGTYTVRLSVTDNLGGGGSSTLTVTVSAAPVDTSRDIDVFSLMLAASASASNGRTGLASVVVRDRAGRPAAGAAISVQWSGLVSGSSSGVTNASGELVLSSKPTKKSGTLTVTVRSITPPAGAVYDAGIYAEPLVRSIAF